MTTFVFAVSTRRRLVSIGWSSSSSPRQSRSIAGQSRSSLGNLQAYCLAASFDDNEASKITKLQILGTSNPSQLPQSSSSHTKNGGCATQNRFSEKTFWKDRVWNPQNQSRKRSRTILLCMHILVPTIPLLIEYFYSKKKRQRPDSNPRPWALAQTNEIN